MNNKEDNLKMVTPEIEPLQKKQDVETIVYQPCSENKKIKLRDIKLQVTYSVYLNFLKVTWCRFKWILNLADYLDHLEWTFR